MFSFMFAVLSSVLFWIGFFVVGFIIGSRVMRHIAPKTYKFISTGYREYDFDPGAVEIFFVLVGNFILWPIILTYLLSKFIFVKLFWPIFCKSVKASSNIIPKFKIETEK